MEDCDRFIDGIYNYCDRWCETCRFASRCRLFADSFEAGTSLDSTGRGVVEASLRREGEPHEGTEEIITPAQESARRMASSGRARFESGMRAEHRELHERTFAYFVWVLEWLCDRGGDRQTDPADPVSVISWFASFNSATVCRALRGLATFDGSGEPPPDHEGSAKVALLGIERSLAAWRTLVAQGEVPAQSAAACLTELEWLAGELERLIPRARAFVRPGFDDPERRAAPE